MSSPSGDQKVDASLAAMRSDAAKWKEAASDLKAPTEAVGQLDLTEAEMSWMAVENGVRGAYLEAQRSLEDMLSKAADYFQKIGDNLESAAQQYENDDARAASDLQRLQGDM